LNQLPTKDKEKIVKTAYGDAKIDFVTLEEDMVNLDEKTTEYVGEEVYLVEIPLKEDNTQPNKISIYANIESFDYIGYGYED
jgi:hypothetical protein